MGKRCLQQRTDLDKGSAKEGSNTHDELSMETANFSKSNMQLNCGDADAKTTSVFNLKSPESLN